jgi:hypothetical protein
MTQPRPLREGDTLGRAGRLTEKGKPIRAERVRDIDPEDERSVAIETIGIETPGWSSPNACRSPTRRAAPPGDPGEREPRASCTSTARAEPRPPRDWEAMEAAKRAEIGKSEREALARSLQRDRRAKKLYERIAWLQQRALVAQSQRAVQVRATDAKSAEGKDQAPQCEGHDAIGYASAAAGRRRVEADRGARREARGLLGRARRDRAQGRVDDDDRREERDAARPAVAWAPPGGDPRHLRRRDREAGRSGIRSEGGQTGRGLPKPERQERAA